MPSALTLRQAKAQYKKRGCPSLTEREARQLEREAQLDRRAWAAREREKSKTTAAQKREQQEHSRIQEANAGLGTQRRVDKYGHKSSQFHLGAFFTKATNLMQPAPIDTLAKMGANPEEFDEESDDLDHSLLSIVQHIEQDTHHGSDNLGEQTGKLTTKAIEDDTTYNMDWESFLDSGTQIERDLSPGRKDRVAERSPDGSPDMHSSAESFGSSGSLGLTSQDIERLDPVVTRSTEKVKLGKETKQSCDRALMPPPLAKTAKLRKSEVKAPSVPIKESLERDHFSLTQLETFIDDDMTLSQI